MASSSVYRQSSGPKSHLVKHRNGWSHDDLEDGDEGQVYEQQSSSWDRDEGRGYGGKCQDAWSRSRYDDEEGRTMQNFRHNKSTGRLSDFGGFPQHPVASFRTNDAMSRSQHLQQREDHLVIRPRMLTGDKYEGRPIVKDGNHHSNINCYRSEESMRGVSKIIGNEVFPGHVCNRSNSIPPPPSSLSNSWRDSQECDTTSDRKGHPQRYWKNGREDCSNHIARSCNYELERNPKSICDNRAVVGGNKSDMDCRRICNDLTSREHRSNYDRMPKQQLSSSLRDRSEIRYCNRSISRTPPRYSSPKSNPPSGFGDRRVSVKPAQSLHGGNFEQKHLTSTAPDIHERSEKDGPKKRVWQEAVRPSPPKKRWCQARQDIRSTEPIDSKPGENTGNPTSVILCDAEGNLPKSDSALKSRTTSIAAAQVSTPPTLEPLRNTDLHQKKLPTEKTLEVPSPKITETPASRRKHGIPMHWLKPSTKPQQKIVMPKRPMENLQPNGNNSNSDNEKDLTRACEKNKASVLDSSAERSSSMPKKPTFKELDVSASTTKPIFGALSPSNRFVTDTSEGGSTVSTKDLLAYRPMAMDQKCVIPASIVMKSSQAQTACEKSIEVSNSRADEKLKLERMLEGLGKVEEPSCGKEDKSSSNHKLGKEESGAESDEEDEETELWAARLLNSHKEDEETELWAARLLGKLAPEPSSFSRFYVKNALQTQKNWRLEFSSADNPTKRDNQIEKLEKKNRKVLWKKKASEARNAKRKEFDEEKALKEMEEERRKRDEAKPLSTEVIRAVLEDDDVSGVNQRNWVRRSVRQPSRALLTTKPVKKLMDNLRTNHPDMVVLKLKKYINDPNAPSAVLDAALNALEENTNCEALYIQNFNEGMLDQQVLHLLRILQLPSCKIWCLNIGETYNVSDGMWEKFTKGLVHTKITHMYASEHTITSAMKDEIRETIRENRKKHKMHIDPNNLDVIIQCTHCWWNPVNAKVLRPYLRKNGYEHILNDKEVQGLRGSTSAAPSN